MKSFDNAIDRNEWLEEKVNEKKKMTAESRRLKDLTEKCQEYCMKQRDIYKNWKKNCFLISAINKLLTWSVPTREIDYSACKRIRKLKCTCTGSFYNHIWGMGSCLLSVCRYAEWLVRKRKEKKEVFVRVCVYVCVRERERINLDEKHTQTHALTGDRGRKSF